MQNTLYNTNYKYKIIFQCKWKIKNTNGKLHYMNLRKCRQYLQMKVNIKSKKYTNQNVCNTNGTLYI
jgi:hypothetical protein